MEAQGLLERAVGDLKARGMKQQDIKLNPGVFETQAKRRVALSLLLGQFAKDHGIVAADDQVRSKIEEFAQSYEDPSEVVAWYFQDAERMNEVQAMVVEDNIVDAIVARAQVTDEPVSLEQLMGNA